MCVCGGIIEGGIIVGTLALARKVWKKCKCKLKK
jgi:hypothetical protein